MIDALLFPNAFSLNLSRKRLQLSRKALHFSGTNLKSEAIECFVSFFSCWKAQNPK
jgi:hypothetical protein